MIGIQPSPSRAARVTAASDDPPNQIGIGRCTGGGTMLTSMRLWNLPVEGHEVPGPKATEHLDLLGLARAARLPVRAERLVFDVVPPETNAEPQPSAAQDVHLGRLLGDRLPSAAAAR